MYECLKCSSMGLIRNIQVQVCNIANDIAVSVTRMYICTMYPIIIHNSCGHIQKHHSQL